GPPAAPVIVLDWPRGLRGAPPRGKRTVVGVLDAQEAVVTAALIGVMALRQEQEGPLRGPGVFFRRVAAQPLEVLPVKRLFCLLLAFAAFGLGAVQQLHVLSDDADACLRRLDASAEHLSAFAFCLAELLLRSGHCLLPVR